MTKSLLRTNREIEEIYERNYQTLFRICFAYLKNTADTEDAVQTTFFKLIKAAPAFESEEHEKAWLIRTATNVCKNVLRHWWHRNENIDDYFEIQGDESPDSALDESYVFRVISDLPDKYKTVVYLYYYEGYTSVEISSILKKPQSTIRNYLHEARAILKERLGDDFR